MKRCCLVAFLLISATSVFAHEELSTFLLGSEEVPGPGDTDGFGQATLLLLPDEGLICFLLVAENVEQITAAHIHEGAFGVAGPVVVPLLAPAAGSTSSGGCLTVSRDLILEIRRNPEEYYVNVHNETFPGGALRGQLPCFQKNTGE